MNLSFLHATNLQEAKNFLQSLGLKDNESDVRAKILSCWESVDIPSCPGSGKTTILVAKLAWAVEHWELDGAGICVLSHTNVAKDEIIERLSASQARRLFGYPHFVGTIHEFVNKFIALPYMKSFGKRIRLIDDEYHDRKAETILKSAVGKELRAARTWQSKNPHKNVIGGLRLVNESLKYKDYSTDTYSDLPLGPDTNSFMGFQKVKESLHNSGFYCHDELLFVAKDIIDKKIYPVDSLQRRFPLVLIDEAQDNNEIQSNLLDDIFNSTEVVFQRFGDEDQQVFDFGKKSTTDPFPNKNKMINGLYLEETQRCSQLICSAASKFSLSSINIKSVVETSERQIYPHLILFDKNSIERVIPKFVELTQSIVDITRTSTIKVIGQIGKENLATKNFPYSIYDYEHSYVKPSSKRVGKPKNLRDLINNTLHTFSENNENYKAINVFFSGIIRLLTDYLDINHATSYPFRRVKELLDSDELNSDGLNGRQLFHDLLNLYELLIKIEPDYTELKTKMEKALRHNGFTNYVESFFDLPVQQSTKTSNRYAINGVPVELNTIAGVKGETHTATLVLETFLRTHNVKGAIESMVGKTKTKPTETYYKRIRHLYVAMTRPTEFLCIALPKSEYDELCQTQSIKTWFECTFKLMDIT